MGGKGVKGMGGRREGWSDELDEGTWDEDETGEES